MHAVHELDCYNFYGIAWISHKDKSFKAQQHLHNSSFLKTLLDQAMYVKPVFINLEGELQDRAVDTWLSLNHFVNFHFVNSHFVNSHFVNIGQMRIDKVGSCMQHHKYIPISSRIWGDIENFWSMLQ